MKLVVGLGNPGASYRGTRHNLGYAVLDELAARWHASAARARFHGRLASATAPNGTTAALLWPETYMNRSGLAVAEAVGFFRLDPTVDLLVICDDLNLPLGRLRLRTRGSDGGQRGLRDVIQRLGTQHFARLRLGIGPKPPGADAAQFVLSRFLPEEEAIVAEMLQRAAACAETWLTEGADAAMARYNASRRPETASEERGSEQPPTGD